jgi:uncharacterized protein
MSEPDRDGGGREHAVAALVTLRRRVEDHFDAAMARSPGAMQCRAGCSRCCHQRFGVFELEAERLRTALARLALCDPALRERVRQQADAPAAAQHCALLVDDRCTVYDERPILCRTHGLPTRVRAAQLQGCPLNFVGSSPPAQSVLELQAVNAPLSIMAHMWDGHGNRVALAELARAVDVLDEA